MRYYGKYISSSCRNDYFDYTYTKNNEVEIDSYYIESEYEYHSLVRSFLSRFGCELSDEALIKHNHIFTKSSECIEIINKIISSKKLNIELIKAYLPHINIVEYINETQTKDESLYELIALNKDYYRLEHLKIVDVEIFDKYLKDIYRSKVADWNRYDYSWFMGNNRQLTYINFYRKYLDIFDIKPLLIQNLNVPSKVVEDFIIRKYITKEIPDDKDDYDYDFKSMVKDYSNKLSIDFIKDNIDVLGALINWHEAKLSIDTLMELEDSIKYNIVNCYTNKNNIFPVNKTIEYIKKYLNIEEFINFTETIINGTACKEYGHNGYNNNGYGELIRRIEVFIKYIYLNEDRKYYLKLMLEIVHTCVALINESNKLMENGVSIQEVQISIKNAYAGKIEELKLLFNDIKENI